MMNQTLDHTNFVEYNEIETLSLKQRRARENALLLAVEQAQVILNRFHTMVPFVQKLEGIIRKRGSNIDRLFYRWKRINQVEARSQALNQAWRLRYGCDKIKRLLRSQLKVAAMKRFTCWKNTVKISNHAIRVLFKCLGRHHQQVKRRGLHVWYNWSRDMIAKSKFNVQATKLQHDNNDLEQSMNAHEAGLLLNVQNQQKFKLLHLLRHYKRRNLSEALLLWQGYLQRMRGTSPFRKYIVCPVVANNNVFFTFFLVLLVLLVLLLLLLLLVLLVLLVLLALLRYTTFNHHCEKMHKKINSKTFVRVVQHNQKHQ